MRVAASSGGTSVIGGVASDVGDCHLPRGEGAVAEPGPGAGVGAGGCACVTPMVGPDGRSFSEWSAVGGKASDSAMVASRGTRPRR